MPPRLPARRLPPISRRILTRFYSATTDSSSAPLITVTDVPAPGTGHIRVLELNRPAARNAISRALLSALRTEIDQVQSQYSSDGQELPVQGTALEQRGPTRAVVLASAIDTSFCAGADLKERKGFTQQETADFLLNLRTTFTSLASLPVPTISAISSLALGGGLELALSTHFRVLTSTAVVGLPETRLGIIPGAGGTFRLPALIGMPRARDLILTGRRVSAPEAYFLGIADRLVEVLPDDVEREQAARNRHTAAPPPPEGGEKGDEPLPTKARRLALAEAVRLAMEICEGGPVAIRAGLQAVMYAREEVENAMYQRVVATEDRDEALKAFGEKRKPVFKGR